MCFFELYFPPFSTLSNQQFYIHRFGQNGLKNSEVRTKTRFLNAERQRLFSAMSLKNTLTISQSHQYPPTQHLSGKGQLLVGFWVACWILTLPRLLNTWSPAKVSTKKYHSTLHSGEGKAICTNLWLGGRFSQLFVFRHGLISLIGTWVIIPDNCENGARFFSYPCNQCLSGVNIFQIKTYLCRLEEFFEGRNNPGGITE